MRAPRLLAIAAGSGAVGAAATAALLYTRRSNKLPPSPLDALLDGAPPPYSIHTRVSPDGTSASLYDPRTRNPLCTIERLTTPPPGGKSPRPSTFKEDTAIPPRHRARLADFVDSGWDRGHMTPAADRCAHGADECATGFLLSNVCPQHPSLNRGPWARLEGWVRKLNRADAVSGGRSNVTVYTGPLFLPTLVDPAHDEDGAKLRFRHAALGTPLHPVAVPSAFFKVVVASSLDPSVPPGVAAFVALNEEPQGDPAPSDLVVPLGVVEALSGLTFLAPDKDAGEDKAALDAAADRGGAWRRRLRVGEGAKVGGPPVRKGGAPPRWVHLCSVTDCRDKDSRRHNQ